MELPRLSTLLAEARERKEEWMWDGIIPSRDLTLVAAFMKKGKTTLLTGLVNGLLRTGSYCGRGVQGGRKVLYLAPEEGDTLLKRFSRLGFEEGDDPFLTVIPRGHPAWADLVNKYRMREWSDFVKWLKKEEYDTVVLDGLHTLQKMFEPNTKEDNDGVSLFMTQFVLAFGGMTVVASLHTKKSGGDPRVRVPPEEMIRGASAWMAHPGQVLVMEHDRKADIKVFHAFGRYEGSQAHGWMVRFDEERHDYVAVDQERHEGVEELKEDMRRAQLQPLVLLKLGEAEGLTMRELQERVTGTRATVKAIVEEFVASGVVEEALVKTAGGPPRKVYRVAKVESDGISH